MTNLCKLLRNSEGKLFYSPMIGVCKLLSNDGCFLILEAEETKFKLELDEFGKYLSEQDGECLLFPSTFKRDWSNYVNSTLQINTPVMVADDNDGDCWEVRYYAGGAECFINSMKSDETDKKKQWLNIVPVSEFDFNDLASNIIKSIC